MKRGTLSAHFKAFAYKRLATVETKPSVSNQHEFNGVSTFHSMFGSDRRKLEARFIYLSDADDANLQEDGQLTWYDAREKHPTRSEYRLYYTPNKVMLKAEPDDLCIIALVQNAQDSAERTFVIIARDGTTIETQLEWLFNIQTDASRTFKVAQQEIMESVELGAQARALLEEIGIGVEDASDSIDVDAMLRKFNAMWPSTRELSSYARQIVHSSIVQDDADAALRLWYETEERLFRAYEGVLVGERVRKGFEGVDDFVQFSLSVHNRRKSRAGHALENHFEQLLIDRNISYARNAVTEHKSRPDFLFPGKKQYDDPTFRDSDLRMLGVKTSCKDRWRQILNEAHRIRSKHLLTLDPVVSASQHDEMTASRVVLISPYGLRRGNQQGPTAAISVREFLELVKG